MIDLKEPRQILADAWTIIRDHNGIEERKDMDEWQQLCSQASKLAYTGTHPAALILAKKIAAAVMDYFRELESNG